MNKDFIVAKVRRWRAELLEIVETLKDEGLEGPVYELLDKRAREINDFITALEENSLIPKGDVSFKPEPVMDEITKKVKKIKTGVKRIKTLSEEKSKIIDDLSKE